jgi:hypothetical protein
VTRAWRASKTPRRSHRACQVPSGCTSRRSTRRCPRAPVLETTESSRPPPHEVLIDIAPGRSNPPPSRRLRGRSSPTHPASPSRGRCRPASSRPGDWRGSPRRPPRCRRPPRRREALPDGALGARSRNAAVRARSPPPNQIRDALRRSAAASVSLSCVKTNARRSLRAWKSVSSRPASASPTPWGRRRCGRSRRRARQAIQDGVGDRARQR